MAKIAIILDGDRIYPIFRENGRYYIDFGGNTGRSKPMDFPNDTKAINWLREAVATASLGR